MTDVSNTAAETAEEELNFSGRISILTAEYLIEDSRALDAIHEALDGLEWGPNTLDRIAHIIRATGRPIREPEED